MFSFPLPRSLSRYAPAVRLRRAAGHAYKARNRTVAWCKKERPHGGRFSEAPAPWQASRNLTLKSVVAKPAGCRSRRFPTVRLPRALSCSCLSVCCHSAIMAAFVSFHAWHSVPGEQFAPSWTVCTEPRSIDYHAFKATVLLIPISEAWRIATGGSHLITGLRSEGVLTRSSWSESPNTATLEGQIWLLRSVKASYHS